MKIIERISDKDYPKLAEEHLPAHIPFTGSLHKAKQISGFPIIRPEPEIVGKNEPGKWRVCPE